MAQYFSTTLLEYGNGIHYVLPCVIEAPSSWEAETIYTHLHRQLRPLFTKVISERRPRLMVPETTTEWLAATEFARIQDADSTLTTELGYPAPPAPPWIARVTQPGTTSDHWLWLRLWQNANHHEPPRFVSL